MVERDRKIECLRVAAAFAVVMLHTSAGYLVKIHDAGHMVWWVANFYDAISRWAVPVFLLISGSLLLDGPGSIFLFYRKRFVRVLVPLVFWTVFYLSIRFFVFKNIQSQDVLATLMQGVPYVHLWYLYMLVGLYLFVPFLKTLVQNLDEKSGLLLVFLLCLLSSVNLFLGENPKLFLIKFVPFLGFFIGGYFLRGMVLPFSQKFLIGMLVFFGLIVFGGAGVAMYFYGDQGLALIYDYQSPAVVCFSFLIFILSRQLDFNLPCAASLSECSFGIYLVHPIFLIIAGKLFSISHAGAVFFLIPLLSLVVFLVSWCVVMFLRKYLIGRRIVGG
ncbi:acyltransferase family protein [Aquitalea sp.]|uniref:acyltransferase n=1 Tax=Aquitalea sp. TaxID=1872623 RepID=UPI00258E0D93|nr:acyltransferase family protein [Aquitalea sp.]